MGDAFKALADPTRRRILELLAQGDLTAGEIAAHFDMTKPSVSHHLNILRSAALITDERRGQNIVYSVNLTVFQELMKWFYDCGLVKGDDSNEKDKLFWILTVVCVLNFAAHLYFYPSLPDIVPTHWGASGQVNGWGPKSTVLILAALPFAMLILFEVIRKIDPKHQNFEKFGKVWNLCVVLFTVIMAAFSWLSDLAVFGKLPDSSNLVSILVCGGIGVLFIILGNFMPQIKQNYTFGCRTPWALNDEHNWQRTQRMGGYTFVVMGIVLLVLAFLGGLLGDIATLIVLLAAVRWRQRVVFICIRIVVYGGEDEVSDLKPFPVWGKVGPARAG